MSVPAWIALLLIEYEGGTTSLLVMSGSEKEVSHVRHALHSPEIL